jgi:hypothetical protein
VSTVTQSESAAQDFWGALKGTGGLTGIAGNLLGTAGHVIAATADATSSATKTSGGLSFGDYGLMVIGVVLAVGALLISQKEIIVGAASNVAQAKNAIPAAVGAIAA